MKRLVCSAGPTWGRGPDAFKDEALDPFTERYTTTLIGQYKYCPKRQKYMAFFEVPSILAQEAWRPKYSAPKKGVVYSRSKAYFWSQVHRR